MTEDRGQILELGCRNAEVGMGAHGAKGMAQSD
jgi:hypothetical protein